MSAKAVLNVLILHLGAISISFLGITALSFLVRGEPPTPRLVALSIVLALLFSSLPLGMIWLGQKRRARP
jgi:hypothetical protein